MIQTAYLVGRILAGMGAVMVTAVLILSAVSFANGDNCSDPDCDDVAFSNTLERAFVLLPVSVLVGAAGVALVNDTYRKA